jgi:hypothetical protein
MSQAAKTSRQIFFHLLAALVFTITAFTTSSAHADHRGMDFKAFAAQIRTAQKTCNSGHPADHAVSCQPQGFDFKVLHSSAVTDASVQPLLANFVAIAKDQAGIWADTVLEGAFDADGQTQLDSVEGVYLNGELIAYHITYSEQAWTLGDTGERQASGRITESTFVSVAMSSWFRDDWALAAFN